MGDGDVSVDVDLFELEAKIDGLGDIDSDDEGGLRVVVDSDDD